MEFPIRVVAAVINQRGRYLVCERPTHKRHGGLWEFPGGKCEPNESDEDALRRELREELAVETARVGDEIVVISDIGSDFAIAFIKVEISGEPQILEHTRLRWATLGELMNVSLAPSDRQFVQHLMALQ